MSAALPANLTPDELTILRIVSTIAWADGELSAEERDLLLSTLSQLFAETEAETEGLYRTLQEHTQFSTAQLPQLVAQLSSDDDKVLALKLSYMTIRANGSETTSGINVKEKVAYRQLIDLLGLPEDRIEKTEWAADEDLQGHDNFVTAMRHRLGQFFGRR
jgi:uncharacterized tellurite resistance protein B-like protein